MFGTMAGNVGAKKSLLPMALRLLHNPWIHNLPTGLAGNQFSFYWSMSKQKALDKLTFLKGKKEKVIKKFPTIFNWQNVPSVV